MLHAGTAAGLLVALRDEIREGLAPRWLGFVALASLPAGAAGLALERPIERRLGTPVSIAAGLLGGSVLMALAERVPQTRAERDAGAADALALGLAQALALVPGVSRGGATLAAARKRGFTRHAAGRLSRRVALPVIAGAAVLKVLRLTTSRATSGLRAPLAAGAAAAFVSGVLSARLVSLSERSLVAFAAYRSALAGTVLARSVTVRGIHDNLKQ